MTEIEDCPVCEVPPKVTEFAVNPMFGGGTAFEVRCEKCGLSDGIQWRTMDAAILSWNEFACGGCEEYEATAT